MPIAIENDSVLTLEHIQQLTGTETQQILVKIKLKPKVQESLEERRRSIQNAVSQTSTDQYMLSVSTLGEFSNSIRLRFEFMPSRSVLINRMLEFESQNSIEILTFALIIFVGFSCHIWCVNNVSFSPRKANSSRQTAYGVSS